MRIYAEIRLMCTSPKGFAFSLIPKCLLSSREAENWSFQKPILQEFAFMKHNQQVLMGILEKCILLNLDMQKLACIGSAAGSLLACIHTQTHSCVLWRIDLRQLSL